MQGETKLERQSKCRGPKSQTKTKPETGRQRHRDHPKRLIGRDTIQSPLTAIFDPPPQNQGGKKEDTKPKGPTEDPQGLGVQRRWVFQSTSPLAKNLNRSESGARRELGLGGGWGTAKLSSGIRTTSPKCLLPVWWEGVLPHQPPFSRTNRSCQKRRRPKIPHPILQ